MDRHRFDVSVGNSGYSREEIALAFFVYSIVRRILPLILVVLLGWTALRVESSVVARRPRSP